MKRLFLSISMGILSLSYNLFPGVQTESKNVKSFFSIADSSSASNIAVSLYNIVSLQHFGLSKQAFVYAWKGYQSLLKKKLIASSDYLTICDFSQSSNNKRLYVIDILNQKLITHTWVAHGRNSGGEYATRFSNKPESLQSSLGFYVTGNTYYGEHGLSLRVKGLEPGFNDKALQRAIVIHGADYIGEQRLQNNAYMGRSFGCPALPKNESDSIINTIKEGSCFFIYHPARNYLLGSKLLNG
jgi:hypothetical protein